MSKTVIYTGLAPAVCPTKCGRPLWVMRELLDPRGWWIGTLQCDAGHHVTDSRGFGEPRPQAYAAGAVVPLL